MIFKKCILFLTILLLFFLTRNSLIAEELDSDVLLEKAKLQFLWKNYENAFGMAETILKTDPKNTDALMIVAQVHYI
ncbi:MAG: hypothetical protein N3B13_12725, partial [Deltaproteobacteria bacterium]|nr:hypothetical protein [Deltaproteobacteria bacterium]